jgi:hypothetical protein
VFKQIQALDPQYPDPDGLLVSARQELDAVERQEKVAALYKQGLQHMNTEAWHEALASFEETQRLEVGYRDTDALLARVKQELAKPVHPSLTLTLSVTPRQVTVGDTATWTATLHNDGDDDLTQVTVKRGKESIAEPFSLAAGGERRFTFPTTPSRSGKKTETVKVTAVASNGQTVKARAKTALQAQEIEEKEPPAKRVVVQLPVGFKVTAAPAKASQGLRDASAAVAQRMETSIEEVDWDWGTLGWIALMLFLVLGGGGSLFLLNDLTSVAFSPDGAMVASGSWWDEVVLMWRVSDGAPLRTQEGHKGAVLSVTFSPDGAMMASGSADDKVGLWDASYGALRMLKGHTSDVYSVAFSPDGKLLASGSGDNTIRLWSVPDGSPLQSLKGHTGDVKSVAFSPDGSMVASGSNDKTVRVWQVSDGKLLHTLEGHTSNVEAVAFSPDGVTLASGGWSEPARLWNLADGSVRMLGKPVSVWTHILDVGFSPDGTILAVGSSNNRVLLWQVADGSLLRTLAGHKGDVNGVAFSPDGNTLASASSDGRVRLWDVSTGTSLQTLKAK